MSQVEQLESQLVETKKLIERREVVLRLSNNADFRRIIDNDYIVQDCARFAQLAGDPALTKEQREDAMEMAKAAGHLKRYLQMAIQMGWTAMNQIDSLNAAIEEARIEDQYEQAQGGAE